MEDKNEQFQILLANETSGRKRAGDSINQMRLENDNLKFRMNMIQQENKRLEQVNIIAPR